MPLPQPIHPTANAAVLAAARPGLRSLLRPLHRAGRWAGLLGALCLTPAAWAFDSGSTGADGALAPTVNTEIQLPPSGILNYTSINIPAGVTVKFKKNTLNTPVYLLVSGNATIAGTIDIRGSDGKDSGTYGDGNLADDGLPGLGGPGGYDGGRGGRDDPSLRPELIRGGAGLGPGGGKGGIEGSNGNCSSSTRYYKYYGLGASHANNGGDGMYQSYCGSSVLGPDGAKPYGTALLQPLVGGSGGGGGLGGANYAGSGGGGGGALLIAASGTLSLASTGAIRANGGVPGAVSGTSSGSIGGGGSGGAIRLVATAIAGSGVLRALGGCYNPSTNPNSGCSGGDNYNYGSNGSQGRIRLEAESITYTGSSDPAYVADTPAPIFIANVPSLRIATVGGQAVPASPTGNADLTFPADQTNPVTVELQTVNVPPGNTVLVKLIPAYGAPTEVLSPAIVGSAASGSASVQINLPQGPSVLQAMTTYTVVVAMGEALSRYANNERVEKVQLIATLGGPSQAKLITVSGKEHWVPAALLQTVGFAG